MEVFDVNEDTDVFFMIAAETQGRAGPEAIIGVCFGNDYIL